MAPEPLSASRRAAIVQWAAWLFCAGLVVGLIFTFESIGHIAAWPLLPRIDFDFPGDVTAWRRAHLGLIVNAIAMLAFAAAGRSARLGPSAQRSYVIAVIVTGWANSAGFLTGTLFGVRGLAFGGAVANSATYLFFLVAVASAFVQAILLALGARRMRAAV
ncbi:MAG: hypothetical protein PHP86_17655 [Nevskiales bacterium]|nr:hypothetical protein [Nevskiales bacterium]